jgi:opacity protein-like surface antigen
MVVVALSLLWASPASSQDYARPGFYIGAGVLGGSYTALEDEVEDALRALGYQWSVDTDPTVGFEIYGGYRLHPNFAIEGEFEMLPEADIDVGGAGTVAELETWTFTGNAKAFLLTGRTQPYALIGLGVMGAEIEDAVGLGVSESDSDFTMRFGGGLDFCITENIVVNASVDYVLPTGDVEDLDYVSFGGGIQYRF